MAKQRKKAFIAFALIAAVAADVSHLRHASDDASAQILRSDSDVRPDGYQFNFETSNGIAAQESAQLKNAGREDEAIEVQGSNQYTAPDGTPIQITFIANENGYQPQGAHLPTPPPPQPIPDYIQRSLEYIAAHPQPQENQYQQQNQYQQRGFGK